MDSYKKRLDAAIEKVFNKLNAMTTDELRFKIDAHLGKARTRTIFQALDAGNSDYSLAHRAVIVWGDIVTQHPVVMSSSAVGCFSTKSASMNYETAQRSDDYLVTNPVYSMAA